MIDAVFLDIDGVLTDGAVYVNASGNETKKILFEDIDAVFAFKRAGIKVGFITGEETSFCNYVRNRFQPDFFVSGCKDKLTAFKKLAGESGLDKDRVCYAGDSKRDIDLLKYTAYSFAPADAHPTVKQSAKTVLKSSRGQGVVQEIAEHIFQILKVPAPS